MRNWQSRSTDREDRLRSVFLTLGSPSSCFSNSCRRVCVVLLNSSIDEAQHCSNFNILSLKSLPPHLQSPSDGRSIRNRHPTCVRYAHKSLQSQLCIYAQLILLGNPSSRHLSDFDSSVNHDSLAKGLIT